MNDLVIIAPWLALAGVSGVAVLRELRLRRRTEEKNRMLTELLDSLKKSGQPLACVNTASGNTLQTYVNQAATQSNNAAAMSRKGPTP